MIYVDFESILVPEDNDNQNHDVLYTNKCQNHVCCSYGYKLVCLHNKFSESFKSYLGKDTLQKCIVRIIEKVNILVM